MPVFCRCVKLILNTYIIAFAFTRFSCLFSFKANSIFSSTKNMVYTIVLVVKHIHSVFLYFIKYLIKALKQQYKNSMPYNFLKYHEC